MCGGGGFPHSPDKAQVSNEFEVEPYVLRLALTGLKRRVEGASCSSFHHHQPITVSIQVTLEGEGVKHTSVYPATPLCYRHFIIDILSD